MCVLTRLDRQTFRRVGQKSNKKLLLLIQFQRVKQVKFIMFHVKLIFHWTIPPITQFKHCVFAGRGPHLERCFLDIRLERLRICVCLAVFQARLCAPMTWRRWPTRSQGVSRSRNPQTPPGRLFLKRRFPSRGTTAVN